MVYYIRVIPHDYLPTATRSFDTFILNFINGLMPTTLTPQATTQLQLNMKNGGLGFRNSTTHHAAAYYSSLSSCLNMVAHVFRPDSATKLGVVPFIPSVSILLQKSARDSLLLQIPSDLLTSTSQKILSGQIDRFNYLDLLNSSDPLSQARLRSTAQPHANAYLRALPIASLDLLMTNQEWSTAVGYQLGLPIFSTPFKCSASNCGKLMDVLGHHALRCGKGGDWIKRHNRIRNIFFHYAQQADLAPVLEPKNLMRDCGQKCADFGIPDYNRLRQFAAFDVAITDPTGIATVSNAAVEDLAAADRYAELKRDKYASSLQRNPNILLKPVIFESFGACNETASDAVKYLATRIALRSNRDRANIMDEMRQSISVSLQRSNAIMINKRSNYYNLSLPGLV